MSGFLVPVMILIVNSAVDDLILHTKYIGTRKKTHLMHWAEKGGDRIITCTKKTEKKDTRKENRNDKFYDLNKYIIMELTRRGTRGVDFG